GSMRGPAGCANTPNWFNRSPKARYLERGSSPLIPSSTTIDRQSPLTPALSRPASARGCGQSELQARQGELAGRGSRPQRLRRRPLAPCGRGTGRTLCGPVSSRPLSKNRSTEGSDSANTRLLTAYRGAFTENTNPAGVSSAHFGECIAFLRAIERPVDFYRREPSAGEFKLAGVGKVWRIEAAAPGFEGPPARREVHWI